MSVYDRDYMRPSSSRWSPGGVRWDAFTVVFWLNIVVFVCQYFFGWFMEGSGHQAMPKGGVSLDLLAQGQIWTIFTYMFVHGTLGHLLVNLLMLWFVGRQIQQIFGSAHFLRIYLLGGVLGAALEIAVRAWFGEGSVYLVGASASVFALFLALAVTLPDEVFTALFFLIVPVRVRLWKLAAFIVALNLVLGLAGLVWPDMPGGNVACFAHLGGALLGWYYVRMLGFGGRPLTYRQLWAEPGSGRRQQDERAQLELARSKRRRLAVDLEIDHEAARKRNPSGDPAADVMREEVDPILDKISEQGLHSLTDEERRTLERASRLVSRTADGSRKKS